MTGEVGRQKMRLMRSKAREVLCSNSSNSGRGGGYSSDPMGGGFEKVPLPTDTKKSSLLRTSQLPPLKAFGLLRGLHRSPGQFGVGGGGRAKGPLG